MFNERLIVCVQSALQRGSSVRPTLQGKDASVTLNGVSQTCMRTVGCKNNLLRHVANHWKLRGGCNTPSIVGATVHLYVVSHLVQSGPARPLQGFGGQNGAVPGSTNAGFQISLRDTPSVSCDCKYLPLLYRTHVTSATTHTITQSISEIKMRARVLDIAYSRV